MNRAGPSLLRWLVGRIAYPRRESRCARCGRGVVEKQAADHLRRAGHDRLAAVSELCIACRRRLLKEQFSRSA